MYKKIAMMAMGCILVMTGCGKTASNNTIAQTTSETEQVAQSSISTSVDDMIYQLMRDEGILEESESTSEAMQNVISVTEGVDVDLTVLSSTMVYAEVYNMMMVPEEYIGKNIRINGEYYKYYYEETNQDYHYVLIKDALACCQSGMEFIINTGDIPYPEDGDDVEITGVFSSYEELGETYYYLDVAEL